jgi:hypothetical protein
VSAKKSDQATPEHDEVQIDKRGLPPIGRIILPAEVKITSTKIRWLSALGYEPREIAPYLGCRYQQVRNVLQNPPKRAAREDLPPLTVKVMRLSDDMLEIADQEAMRQQMAAQRTAHLKERRDTNKARRQEYLASQGRDPNEFGNEEVDQEHYQE